jgi:kynurenine formamidase
MQRINPVHLMSHVPGDLDLGAGTDVADDWLIMPTHAASHWDALSHTGYDGILYNNTPRSVVSAHHGATRLGIENAAASGIVGRGVLLDLARLHGVESLEGGQAVGPDELDAACERQGVTVGAGDIVLTRTGWYEQFVRDGDLDTHRASEPGITAECAEWLHERDVAVVAADNWAVEVVPGPESEGRVPLHCILLRDMGVMLGENLNLGELAADCAADGVYEFLFCSSPLKISNGVGSPSNPLAIK